MCAAYESCGGGTCAIDPASLWDIVVLDGTVPTTTVTGEAWDAFGGAPDPFVEIRVGSDTAAPATSTVISDTFSPVWNETVVRGARAGSLMAYAGFQVWDEDISFHGWFGNCRRTISASDFGGSPITVTCPRSDSLGAAGYTLRFRLQGR